MYAYCIIYKYDSYTIKWLLLLPTNVLLMAPYFDFKRNLLNGFKIEIVQICLFLPFMIK